MEEQEGFRVPILSPVVAAVRRRYRVFIAAAALAFLGYVAGQAWQYARSGMREDPRYRVTAASIQTPPVPPWIRTDIRLEALRDAGLHGDLSVLDPPDQLQKRLADAFAFHPWVESVGAVTKRPPNRIFIELTYRRPLLAVEVSPEMSGRGDELWPVDFQAVRLPSGDLTEAELRYLPRLIGVDSTTLTGEVWRDARVQGAVSLATAFGDQWRALQLVDLQPRRSPEVFGDLRYPVFDLFTRGGTRVVWGAAPAFSPPSEAPFATKLATLQGYVAKSGPLDTASITTPAVLDVRNGLQVTPRTAKKDSPRTAQAESSSEEAEGEAVVK
ncbi:MAG: hypothetical protein AAF589_05755 [Planctomycetota bacterium]